MSISSEITSIGENLKKDYQSIANLGADLTGVDKNIENIAELLDEIYDNLPKTEYQEGTEINLGKTIKGKLDFDTDSGKKIVGYGDSEQTSTNGYQLYQLPSSDAKNGVTYTKNDDGTCDIVGTASANTDFQLKIPFSETTLTLGTSYHISLPEAITGINFQLAFYNSSNTWLSTIGLSSGTQETNVTIPNNSNIYYIAFNIRVLSGANVSEKGIKLMLNTGTTRQTFEKYTGGIPAPNPPYPQQIKSVTGNQDVVVSGKNKCNVGEMQLGTISQTDGTTISSSGDVKYSGYISVKPSTIYALSYTNGNPTIRIFKYNGNKTYLGTSVISGMTYTTDSDTHYIRVQGNVSFIDNNFQIEENSTATTYEPYITPTSYQLSLGDIQLNAIGNYKDYIYKSGDSWYVHKATGKTILDGTKTYTKSASYSDETYFCGYFTTGINNFKVDVGAYNSSFQNGLYSAVTDRECMNGLSSQLHIRILASRLSENTPSAVSTWLSNNNVTIIHALNTPIDTQITDTTLISQLEALYNTQSIKGTTIITSNGDLPMIIKARALKGE